MVYDLKKALYWSSALHAVCFAFLILSPYLPFRPYRFRDEKVTWITLPKGTGGDIAAAIKKAADLPKTTIEEQKKTIEKVKPVKPSMTYEKKTAADGKVPEKKKSEEELRIEEALARAKGQIASRKPAVPEAAQIPETTSGGVPEGAAVGAVLPPDDPEKALYQNRIKKLVMNEWIPPLKYADPSLGLICKLVVHINERGEVLSIAWEQKSGTEPFDESARRAVLKASPLEPPPERLKWEALNEGFLFDFDTKNKAP